MLIEEKPNHPRKQDGDESIKGMQAAIVVVGIFHEAVFPNIVSDIVDFLFLGSPPLLEATQAFVGDTRTAKIQTRETFARVASDGFPHHEIISPQILEIFVRCPEFEKYGLAKMKKHRACDRLALVIGEHNPAEFLFQHMPLNICKERKRLGRNSMALAGLAKKTVENPDRLEALREFDG